MEELQADLEAALICKIAASNTSGKVEDRGQAASRDAAGLLEKGILDYAAELSSYKATESTWTLSVAVAQVWAEESRWSSVGRWC